MPRITPLCRHALCLVVLLILLGAARADDAGTVRLAVGEAWMETGGGERFDVVAGQRIAVGAALVTGNGLVQVTFPDGALMSVQKHSRLVIERYRYAGREDGSEWALFELVRGGLRAVSGAIGHARADRYRVRTAFATIGIRGTEYKLLVCETACALDGGPQLPAGLHAETTQGTIFIENGAGILDVPAGRGAFVRDALTPPAFAAFSADFALHGGHGELRDDRSANPDSPDSEGPSAPSSTATAAATDGVRDGRVRILSAPGEPLVVGSRANLKPQLARASVQLNADLGFAVPGAAGVHGSSTAPGGEASRLLPKPAGRAALPSTRAASLQGVGAAASRAGFGAAPVRAAAFATDMTRATTYAPLPASSTPAAAPSAAPLTARAIVAPAATLVGPAAK